MFPSADHLLESIGALAERDVAEMSPAELDAAVRAVGQALPMLEAEALRLAGEWERQKVWMADGSRSARACLGRRWGVSIGAAGDRLRVAARLREAPATRAAFAAGDLSLAKARLLCQAVAEDVPEWARDAFRESEAKLVESAVHLSENQVREVMAVWDAHIDPDGDRQPDPYEGRGFAAVETLDGAVDLKGSLDAEQGQFFLRALGDVKARLWRLDHHNPGGEPGQCDDGCDHRAIPRTDRQLTADALVELARLAAGYDPASDTYGGTTGTTSRVAAVVDLDDDGSPTGGMLADSHHPISADTAQRLCCDTRIHGVVLDHRQIPLHLTHGKGQISAGLREAVILRDGGCAFPGCNLAPRCCDVHHARWRSAGGTHDIANLVLLCHHHHRLQHEGKWTARIAPDTGRPVFTHPDGTLHRPDPSPLQTRHRVHVAVNGGTRTEPHERPPPARTKPI